MKGPWRNRQIVRLWDTLVLLRARPRSLAELASEFGVNQRTIRRDMEALCEVGFPLICSRDDVESEGANVTWTLAPIPEWPLRERTPTGKYLGRAHTHILHGAR